ncbi:MAG: hypothetical protein AAGL90_04380 [Pseudomonadota bacterium]
MEILQQFNADMSANSPDWVLIWVRIMVLVLSLSAVFSVFHAEARWILLGTLLGMAGTLAAYSLFGFTRLMGLGHILFWSPTLLYMLTIRGRGMHQKTVFARWLLAAIIVMGVSLMFDYLDLLRWLLGERDPISR